MRKENGRDGELAPNLAYDPEYLNLALFCASEYVLHYIPSNQDFLTMWTINQDTDM